MRDAKTLLRLALFDIEAHPLWLQSSRLRSGPNRETRASQTGLFIPLAPEPEKLEITLARLAKLVGPENVGSPELLIRTGLMRFRVKRFTIVSANKKKSSDRKSQIADRKCVMASGCFPTVARRRANHAWTTHTH